MTSKLEQRLGTDLDLLARSERWRFGPPVAQHHPEWCCEHTKRRHRDRLPGGDPAGEGVICLDCYEELAHGAGHAYAKGRDWSLDFAWPALKVAVECEGVVYAKAGEAVGRHQQGQGFTRDLEKHAQLQLAGWRVVRVGSREIKSGAALALIERALEDQAALLAARG